VHLTDGSVAHLFPANLAIVSEAQHFLVKKGDLPSATQGVRYRKSKFDYDRDDAVEPWGSVVAGFDEGDGWVRVHDRFLPFSIQGQSVLEPTELQPTPNVAPRPIIMNL